MSAIKNNTWALLLMAGFGLFATSAIAETPVAVFLNVCAWLQIPVNMNNRIVRCFMVLIIKINVRNKCTSPASTPKA